MRIAISLLTCITLYNTALATPLQCPERLKTSQAQQGKIPGWEAYQDNWNAVYPLSHVTFYAQHPKEHAALTPDQEHPKNNQLTWTFGNEAIWLACGYNNTSVQLIQKLPDRTKRCVVTYDKAVSQVQKIECS